MKRCTRCGKRLPTAQFNKKGSGWTSHCKACLSAYYRQAYQTSARRRKQVIAAVAKRRRGLAKLVIEAKTNKPCMDCGVAYPPHVMEFDHCRGQKSANVSQVGAQLGWSPSKIRLEIAKCDVVCANCHRERTYRRKSRP